VHDQEVASLFVAPSAVVVEDVHDQVAASLFVRHPPWLGRARPSGAVVARRAVRRGRWDVHDQEAASLFVAPSAMVVSARVVACSGRPLANGVPRASQPLAAERGATARAPA